MNEWSTQYMNVYVYCMEANFNNVNRNERNRGMLNLEIVWFFGIYLSENLRNKNVYLCM